MDRQLAEFLERGVSALEAMAQDPVLEIEHAPPICPHCNRMNPIVHVEEDSNGPVAECVLAARCSSCGRTFFAMPVTWHMFTEKAQVETELQERAAMMENGEHQN